MRVSRIGRNVFAAQNGVLEVLEKYGPMGTVDVVIQVAPRIKALNPKSEEPDIRSFIQEVIRGMRYKKTVLVLGEKSFQQAGSARVAKCLVIGLKPTNDKKSPHQETLEAMQKQARHYLETRQPEMMGLKWS